MAFVDKTRSGGWGVFHGANGRLLSEFSGRGAKAEAEAERDRLHKKNKPRAEHRGARARRADDERIARRRSERA